MDIEKAVHTAAQELKGFTREAIIEQCATRVLTANDEWWKSMNEKDKGKSSNDLGSLPLYIMRRVQDLAKE